MSSKSNVKVFRRGKQGRVLGQILAQTQLNATQSQLVQTVKELAAEVESLQQRLVQIEHSNQIAQDARGRQGPRRQPPLGQTAMQAIQGQWPGEETTEELLAMLKALD